MKKVFWHSLLRGDSRSIRGVSEMRKLMWSVKYCVLALRMSVNVNLNVRDELSWR